MATCVSLVTCVSMVTRVSMEVRKYGHVVFPPQLIDEVGLTVAELRKAGFTADELRDC